MRKYKNAAKSYKSARFTPKKNSRFSETYYQDLVVSTLKQKYQYFIVGIGVLFGLLAGTSYLVLKNTSSNNIAVTKPVVVEKVAVQPTAVQPTQAGKVIAKAATPTVVPTKASISRPAEVVEKPKVDPQKAAAAANAKPGQGYTKYVVKAGDTLWKIAEKTYKSGFNYKDLVAYNKIQNPSNIEVGQEILLPTVAPDLPTDPNVLAQGGVGGPSVQGEIGEGAMTAPVTDTSLNYAVVKGDTLWTIAERTYGDGFAWKDIAKANGVSDPEKLEVGTKLVIPR